MKQDIKKEETVSSRKHLLTPPNHRGILHPAETRTYQREALINRIAARSRRKIFGRAWCLGFIWCLVFGVWCFPSPAATITGTMLDPRGSPSTNRICFYAQSTPLADSGTVTIFSVVCTNLVSGKFTNDLHAGDYQVVCGKSAFHIAVPSSTNTYQITELITDNLVYVLTSLPTGLPDNADGALTNNGSGVKGWLALSALRGGGGGGTATNLAAGATINVADGNALTNLDGTKIAGAVAQATHATNADSATTATSATSAGFVTAASLTNLLPAANIVGAVAEATHATNADNATTATSATTAASAGFVTAASLTNLVPAANIVGALAQATHATNADNATTATSATIATSAGFVTAASLTNLLPAANIVGAVAQATHATNADNATTATSATSATTATYVTSSPLTNAVTNLTLPNVGTAGTYAKVTTDAQGRIISGTSLTNAILTVAIDGNGSVIGTGAVNGYPVAGDAYTISGWSITAMGSSPTCTIDVWKIASGTALPTVSNSIMGTKPALATGNVIESTTLTGWSTAVTKGDIWGINIDAVTVATNIVFQLFGYR